MSTNNIRQRVDAAGYRTRTNQPKDVITDRFAFAGTLTDNTTVGSTSPADLTASGALKSRAVVDRLGVSLPAADPTVVAVIERIGLQFHGGVETTLILKSLAREAFLRHEPAGDIGATVDLGRYLVDVCDDGQNGVIATGAFGGAVKSPDLIPLPTPIVVDLQRDVFYVSLLTLVDSAGNVPFTLWCDGYLFHNRDFQRSNWVDELPDAATGQDLKAVIAETARYNALREIKWGRSPMIKGK